MRSDRVRRQSMLTRAVRRAMFVVIGVALLPAVTSSTAAAQVVGEPLPAWTPGTLDIHQINTGRGDAALLVFPDGTSLLIDAGAFNLDRQLARRERPTGVAFRASGSHATLGECSRTTPTRLSTTA